MFYWAQWCNGFRLLKWEKWPSTSSPRSEPWDTSLTIYFIKRHSRRVRFRQEEKFSLEWVGWDGPERALEKQQKGFLQGLYGTFSSFTEKARCHGEPERPGGPGLVGNDREELYSGSSFGTKLEEGSRRELRTSCVQISDLWFHRKERFWFWFELCVASSEQSTESLQGDRHELERSKSHAWGPTSCMEYEG